MSAGSSTRRSVSVDKVTDEHKTRFADGTADIDSSLVFLDFTNDIDRDGPATVQEWRGATRMVHAVLGRPASLEEFGVFHAYIDAKQLTDIHQ